MTDMKTKYFDPNEQSNVTWWMHLGSSIKGDVFVCGDLHSAYLNLLSNMCDRVFIFDESSHITKQNSNIVKVSNKTCLDYSYDAIIFNRYNNFYNYDDSQIMSLIINNLNDDGAICIYEPNIYSLQNNHSTIFSKALNIFSDLRLKMFSRLTQDVFISKYQTFSYDNNPYESNRVGTCSSNKNTFTLKDKVKKLLLKGPFSRLITNSNIWVVEKGGGHNNLICMISGFLKKQIYLKKYTKINYEIIYYKHSKVIFSLKDPRYSEEFIVVVALDDEAVKQRKNEKETIEHLRGVDEINELVTDQYYSEIINGLNCYIMRSYKGITVDINTNDSTLMISNAYKKLIVLSDSTYVRTTDNIIHINNINKYFDVLLERWPSRKAKIIKLRNYVFNALDNNLIMAVCMHGDFKLENSILNNKRIVVGIIDWELSVINGLPLIDLLYLLIYNYQVKESKEFEEVYFYLLNKSMLPNEVSMIEKYCERFSIDENARLLLTIVFFIHHFSCRFYLDERNQSMVHVDECLELMMNKIEAGVVD